MFKKKKSHVKDARAKGHILYDSISGIGKISGLGKSIQRQKADEWLPGAGAGGERRATA